MSLSNGQQLRQALLTLLRSEGYSPLVSLESADFQDDKYGRIEGVVAAGSKRAISISTDQIDQLDFNELDDFAALPEWKFCQFSYDLKNSICRAPRKNGPLSSKNEDPIGFPLIHCFIPEICFVFHKAAEGEASQIECIGDGAEALLALCKAGKKIERPAKQKNASLEYLTTKEDYLETVERIRNHIREGDVYEINYCQMLYSDQEVQPLDLFFNLMKVSPAPFSAYFEDEARALVSASPERFLQRQDRKIISQPIKGTAARSSEHTADRLALEELLKSEKDRAENVMIVDLVRNDFTDIAETGTIKVEELCGAYSFPQVHQLISTISGRLRKTATLSDILRSTFPMGSMTGAPKIAAMQLIEAFENFRRGLYAGSIGYIDPAGNFDFNVIIRSALYHKASKRLWIPVGGAITWDSDPKAEYEECLLKASGLVKALGLKMES